MTSGDKKSLARSLGEFFGHIAKGVKTPAAGEKVELSRSVEERETTDDQGRKVTLRRTTIEEIEVERETDRD